MKKTILATMLAAVCMMVTTNAAAQDNDNRAERRAEFRARQTERLIRDLKLNDEQKQQFEPIYNRYLDELAATMPQEQADNRSQENNDNLTDAQATEQLQQIFARQEQQIQQQQLRLEIQKKYLAEMSAILTPQQLIRVFRPQNQRNRGNNEGWRQGGRGPRGNFNGGPRGGGFGGGFGGDF